MAAPPSARAILERLAEGPPVGTLPPGALRAPATGEEDLVPPDRANGGPPTGSPVRWLVDHKLLIPISGAESGRAGAVELPREVGLLLRRETGIDGLYMGFPFVLAQPRGENVKPRIAPALLWPIRIGSEVGQRGRFTLAFDRDREEVRINPALQNLLGPKELARWETARDNILAGATGTRAVMDNLRRSTQAEARRRHPRGDPCQCPRLPRSGVQRRIVSRHRKTRGVAALVAAAEPAR